MKQRDAKFIPQAAMLFVQKATPRPPDTLRTNSYSVCMWIKFIISNRLYIAI